MKTLTKISILISILTLVLSTSCGGRLPEPKTASSAISSHFHRYAKKYPTSIIGTHKGADEVQVLDTQEIHKHLAAVTSLLKFEDGSALKIRAVLQKKTLRWVVTSWETL